MSVALGNCQTCVQPWYLMQRIPQGPWQAGSGSAICPLYLFPSGLGFSAGLASQQLQKSFPRTCGGKSPCGLIMNFDLWAVPGGYSVHALRACILCLHKGMLHCISHVGIFTVRVGMLCVHMSCWHFVHAVSMLCLHDDILCLHDGMLCMNIGMLCMNIGMLCMNIDIVHEHWHVVHEHWHVVHEHWHVVHEHWHCAWTLACCAWTLACCAWTLTLCMNIGMLCMNIGMLCMNTDMLCMHVGIVSSINAIDMLEILCMLNLTQITPHMNLLIYNIWVCPFLKAWSHIYTYLEVWLSGAHSHSPPDSHSWHHVLWCCTHSLPWN